MHIVTWKYPVCHQQDQTAKVLLFVHDFDTLDRILRIQISLAGDTQCSKIQLNFNAEKLYSLFFRLCPSLSIYLPGTFYFIFWYQRGMRSEEKNLKNVGFSYLSNHATSSYT